MQAIREKLSDISAMRKAKNEAKEEEKAEKELAKARIEVAHEVRLAREAEAAMDLHVSKAAEKVAQHEAKHGPEGITPVEAGHGTTTGAASYNAGSNTSHASDPSGPGSQVPKSL